MGRDTQKPLDEGGAKERHPSIKDEEENPTLQKENRQAVKNQGSAKPEDYPDRGENPA